MSWLVLPSTLFSSREVKAFLFSVSPSPFALLTGQVCSTTGKNSIVPDVLDASSRYIVALLEEGVDDDADADATESR
jgi:hypothetical protein